MSGWLEALLGKVSNSGVSIPLSKGLNFTTDLVAALNPSTKQIDVSFRPTTLAKFFPGAVAYDVRDFGAACDGIADDTAAINAAIAAANASPGTIYLGKKHRVTAALTAVTGNNVRLRGRGGFNGGTDILVNAAAAPTALVTLQGQFCVADNFRILAVPSSYLTGCGIKILSSYQSIVRGVRIEGMANGIEIDRATLSNIENCEFRTMRADFGIWVHGTAAGQAHNTRIDRCLFDSTATSVTGIVHDSYAHTVRILDSAVLNGGYGLRVVDTLSGGADRPHFTRCVNLECDHNEFGGVVLTAGEQAEFEQLFITSVQDGVGFEAQSTYSGDYRINGGLIFSTTKEGIKLAARHGIISNVIVGAASIGSPGVYDAIAVATNTHHWSIVGCSAGPSFNDGVPESRYGISIGSSCDQFVVEGNRLSQNVTGGVLNASGLAATRIVRNNTPNTNEGWRLPNEVTESPAVGTFHDYTVAEGTQALRLNPSGSGDVIITGFAFVNGNTGAAFRVFKQGGGGTDRLVFKHDQGSAAANRLQLPGNGDFILDRDNDAVDWQYIGGRFQPVARLVNITGLGQADASGAAVPFKVRVAFSATGVTGTMIDVTVWNANAPFALRILKAELRVTTAAGTACALRTAAAGAGSVVLPDVGTPTQTFSTATAGRKADNAGATATVAAGGSLFFNVDRAVAGELVLTCVRT